MARVGRRSFSLEQVLAAIKNSYGITQRVADRLGCDWGTAKRYIHRWEATRVAFRAERERLLDASEETVTHAVIDERDVQTAKWVLARLGRSRGWGEERGEERDDDAVVEVVLG